MQKAEKMQELRVFAQEIRVETLKTVGSLWLRPRSGCNVRY